MHNCSPGHVVIAFSFTDYTLRYLATYRSLSVRAAKPSIDDSRTPIAPSRLMGTKEPIGTAMILMDRTGGTDHGRNGLMLAFRQTAMLDAAIFGYERYFNEHQSYKAMGGKTPAQLAHEWYHRSSKRFLRQPVGSFTAWRH